MHVGHLIDCAPQAWVHDDEAVEYLKTLKILVSSGSSALQLFSSLTFVCAQVFGGGPLASKTGDTLVKAGVKLVIAYGGTEFGGPTQAYPEDADPDAPVQCDEDWAWMRFSKRAKIRWVPEGDGTYELQLLVRNTPLKPFLLLIKSCTDHGQLHRRC